MCAPCYIAEHGMEGSADAMQRMILDAEVAPFNNAGAVGIACQICSDLWTAADASQAIELGMLEASVRAHCQDASHGTPKDVVVHGSAAAGAERQVIARFFRGYGSPSMACGPAKGAPGGSWGYED